MVIPTAIPSADSAAGMARGGSERAVPNFDPRPRPTLAYCGQKMVLTMGATLAGARTGTRFRQGKRDSPWSVRRREELGLGHCRLRSRHRHFCRRQHPPLVAGDGTGDVSERLAVADLRRRGCSNGYRLRLWKVELQRFADETGLAVTVLSSAARHQPVEQDRAPAVLAHQHELARATAHQSRGRCRIDRCRHHAVRSQGAGRTGSRPVPHGR